jgi:endonuclease/exonuclease/phosphatase family metal-dependent hydrolase
MVGDFNTTPYNADYALITRCMNDAWEQSGHGMGNTFPGVNSFEREGKLLFSLIPKWLIRIDFIFHTFDITTSHAEIGVWDQNSDHRPVVARLNLPLSNRPTR